MVISKLDKARVLNGLSRLQEFILVLREFSSMPEEEFFSDKRNPATVDNPLRKSLETIFDLGRHILSKTFGAKELEYKEIARLFYLISRADLAFALPSQSPRHLGSTKSSLRPLHLCAKFVLLEYVSVITKEIT